MRRMGYYRRRRRIRLIALISAAVTAVVLCTWKAASCVYSKKDSEAVETENIGNVLSEAYMELIPEQWNPLDEEPLPVNSEKTEEQTTEPHKDTGPKPYPESWNIDSSTEVIRTTLSGYSGKKFISLEGGGQVVNHTSVENSVLLEESLLPPAFKISVNEKPQVLIMHTHTTESYEPEVRESFDPSFNYRTTDEEKNVIAVGDAICEKLEAANIEYIHDTTIHDYPSYTGAYERSRETVKAILDEYPSIKVVLDIHRDAIGTGDSITQPIAEINGKEAAQVMIISGCDDGTMGMPNYMFNFRFACRLQEEMETTYPGLTRPVLFDYRRYNQNLTTGSLLIEVGSHGNTLEQALYAGSLFGDSLAQVLLDLH